MSRTFGRIAFLFVLAILLAAPWSAAEWPRSGGDTSPNVFSQAWSWLSSLWSEIGCGLDPNGLCRPAQDNLEIGCGIDPDGRCRDSSQRHIGCIIDPNGGCRDSSQTGEQTQRDIGCLIDPSGGCGQ